MTHCHGDYFVLLQQNLSDFDFVFLQNENRHNYNIPGLLFFIL